KVMYEPNARTSVTDIENILIYTPTGGSVRVREVGKVVEASNPPTIERKDRQRIITVSTIVDGVPMSDVVKASQAEIAKMDLPSGVNIELSGTYEDQQDSFADLGLLAVLIILLVYIVMASQFESLTYPGIIMTSLLFAFSGVILILLITGTNLNIMSLIGSIMLIGIVVKNGIVLIDYINLNRERGMSIRRAVIHGGKSRLRPVIMTSLTTILGMVPMAVGTGEGAAMWRPMGIAVIGGLTFSTILTLLFVPALYCVFAYNGVKLQRRKNRKKVNEMKLNETSEEQ
ncbi:MAG: efflux RND transporter permease subunit, partial [Muribaculaceae bacterium]|nr:efflux RND transporter permease subunit [Muribaculaceae bacterium]